MKKRLLGAFSVAMAFAMVCSTIAPWNEVSAQRSTALTRTESARPSATFSNPAPITWSAAASNLGSPYPSPIQVSGLTGNITEVKVTLTGFNHTFADDLSMVLVGPTGAAIMLNSGAGPNGDQPSVNITLADSGATQLPDGQVISAGTYRPAGYYTGDDFPAPGPGTNYNHPGPAGGFSATFAGTFNGTDPNGTWNLFTIDFAAGDGGSISGGWSIEITTEDAGPISEAPIDFNGDGRTDYVVVRNTGGGAGGQVTWYVAHSGGTPRPAQPWGIATDFFVPADYDGDGWTDYAIWRPGVSGEAAFYILHSRTNTVRVDRFGQEGDDPTVVGDYNGDGRDEPAVYRAGAAPDAQSFWFYRVGDYYGSTAWGRGADYPAPGDYDGDGRHDFVVQSNAGGGQARFWKNMSTDGIDAVIFGTPTDLIVPGDYDGDGKTDIAVARASGGSIEWAFEPSGTSGTTTVSQFWGVASTDYPVMGDYNGDGEYEYAVWRESNGTFYIMTVGDNAIWTQAWGQDGDYPVANFSVH